MPRSRRAGDALRRDGTESEPHRAAQDGGVVVHGGEDQRIAESHATQPHRQARVPRAEGAQTIERKQAEPSLAEGERGGLWEPAQNAAVESAVEPVGGGAGHTPGSVSRAPTAAGSAGQMKEGRPNPSPWGRSLSTRRGDREGRPAGRAGEPRPRSTTRRPRAVGARRRAPRASPGPSGRGQEGPARWRAVQPPKRVRSADP